MVSKYSQFKLSCGVFILRASQRFWRTRDIFGINFREQRISLLSKETLTNLFLETMEFIKGEKVKFSRDLGNMLSSGGSRGGPRGPPPPPLFWVTTKSQKEEEPAGKAKKIASHSLSSTTAISLGDPLY